MSNELHRGAPDKASLEFLAQYDAHRQDARHSASFLHSAFDDECWTLKFGRSNPVLLDFRLHLSDGVALNRCDDGQLLELFKMWICSADHGCASRGVFAASTSKQARVAMTVKLIDYCLLNGQALGLVQHGLRLFNGNNMRTLLSQLASAQHLTTSIYQWPQRLTRFLQSQLDGSQDAAIEQALQRFSFLNESPALTEDDETDAFIDQQLAELGQWTTDNVIRLRAALWQNGWYKRNGATDFRWGLNTDRIITTLYAGRTLGRIKCPSPQSLSLQPIERRQREYPAAPVRHQHQGPCLGKIGKLMHVLHSVNDLAPYSPSCPLSPLPDISRAYLRDQFKITRGGRYRSAPVSAVLVGMRHALEFYLGYGQAILSSYLALAVAAHQAQQSILAFASRQSIARFLAPELEDLHVQQWCLNTTPDRFASVRTSRGDFYAHYRQAPGLWELLRILFGAIALVLGALQARRSSELQQAMADTCLTDDLQSFVTVNRKTGLMGFNQSITRPVPPVVSQMLVSLQGLQTSLIKANLLAAPVEILSYPSLFGPLRKLSHVAMNQSMDFFCDFFETPQDADGRRYYFRQHQLRRFFAQVFFWHHDNDSLDVLRWMLGHSDTQMIYHYISETTPGEVLRQVKSEWGTHRMKKGAADVEGLKAFLQQKYGALDFTLLSEEALQGYIEQSLAQREVLIEPVFVHDDQATRYTIMVTVRPQSAP